jgi:hypothetical protein
MSNGQFRIPIDEAWANALLSAPDDSGKAISAKLREARENLARVVAEARQTLETNPLTPVVAAAKAQETGVRGTVIVLIEDTGEVVMSTVQNDEDPNGKSRWTSNLPPLEVLRREAAALGVDISSMGRQKRVIVKALEIARTAPPRRKMIRTGVAISAPVVVTLAER